MNLKLGQIDVVADVNLFDEFTLSLRTTVTFCFMVSNVTDDFHVYVAYYIFIVGKLTFKLYIILS